jgi:ribonuclease BN (tRNA processing enzyme)
MKVVLVPSASGVERSYHYLSSYVVNDSVAIDAGGLGFHGDLTAQGKVHHIFLTHTHLDHTASLPIFLENVYGVIPEGVVIHGSATVLDSLQKDIFNDRVMPDFIRISHERKPAFLRLAPLEENKTVEVEGLRITPVEVNHVVPTFSFVIEGKQSAVAVVTDTAPTKAIWKRLEKTPNLKAIFLEASFPNSMAFLAELSGHLTSDQFHQQAAHVGPDVQVIAVHLKARTHDLTVSEVMGRKLPNIQIAEPGRVYEF